MISGFAALSRTRRRLAGFNDVARLLHALGCVSDRPRRTRRTATSRSRMDPPWHHAHGVSVSRAFSPRHRDSSRASWGADAPAQSSMVRAPRGARWPLRTFRPRLRRAQVSDGRHQRDARRAAARPRPSSARWADVVVHREDGMYDAPRRGMAAAACSSSATSRPARRRTVRVPAARRPHAALLERGAGTATGSTTPRGRGFLFLMIIAGNETTARAPRERRSTALAEPRTSADAVDADPKLDHALGGGRRSAMTARRRRSPGRSTAERRAARRGACSDGGRRRPARGRRRNRDERVFTDRGPLRPDAHATPRHAVVAGHGLTSASVGARAARGAGRAREVQRAAPRLRGSSPAGISARIPPSAHTVVTRRFCPCRSSRREEARRAS
jgi:hypothetical protein